MAGTKEGLKKLKNLKNELFFCSQLNEQFVPIKEIDNGRFVRNPERPSRLLLVNRFLKNNFQEIGLLEFPEDVLLLVHEEKYVSYIRKKSMEVMEGEYIPEVFFVDPMFDTGTPIKKETYAAAFSAVQATLTAVEYSLSTGKVTYVLTRPPGHHAMRKYGGGYCYFNNVGIAARYLENKGMRVAIFDIDFHHGNGTQDIFYDDPNVLYVSIHGDPKIFYPWYSGHENETGIGKAEGTNLNIPLPSGTNFSLYKTALESAYSKIIRYEPDFFILSFGTDTHINDPVGKFSLVDSDYREIGIKIAKIIEKVSLGIIVHEGGYSSKANLNAVKNFVDGLLS